MADLFSADEFAQALARAIVQRNPTHDVDVGPIADIVINPLAGILASQEQRIDRIRQLILLQATGTFTDEDLEAFVANEGIRRLPGSPSTVELTFYRYAAPDSPKTVQAHHPVATFADEDSGESVTFATDHAVTLPPEPEAAAYWNPSTRRYEVRATATSVQVGSATQVGPGRVIRSLKPLTGFDGVTNTGRSVGGRNRESRADLVARYLISLMGTTPATASGISKAILAEQPAVLDHLVVFGDDPQLTRAPSDAGAVDVHILGDLEAAVQESVVYLGPGQRIVLRHQPVTSVFRVWSQDPPVEYAEGLDYVTGRDDTGRSGSVKARDYISFLPDATALPEPGSTISVGYTYNALVRRVQDSWSDRAKRVPGTDLLFRAADRVDVVLEATLYPEPGFEPNSVRTAVYNRLYDYINSLKLGQPVEISDLHKVARRVAGVDNLIVSALHRPEGSGASDIAILASEYARIEDANFTLDLG